MIQNVNDLFMLKKGVRTRWASPENLKGTPGSGGKLNYGRKGMPFFPLFPGESATLVESKEGPGIIRRIWATLINRSPAMLRSLRLDFFWEDLTKPAFSVPFGDFFCCPLARLTPFDSALFSSPEGRSFNCFVPMPFRSAMKITLTNEGNDIQPAVYYDIDYTLGDSIGDEVLYFHAFFNHEHQTKLRRDFRILPRLTGMGRFLGANIGVIVNRKDYLMSWWGEGEVKIYLDGDKDFPTLCGTGTEDYIGTGYCLGAYSNLYQGCPLADEESGQYGFYRYHIPDPIFFYSDIKVTVQQIGFFGLPERSLFKEQNLPVYHASGPEQKLFDPDDKFLYPPYFERSDDWSSCAYFYYKEPYTGFEFTEGVAERCRDLDKGSGAADGPLDEEMGRAFIQQAKTNFEQNK